VRTPARPDPGAGQAAEISYTGMWDAMQAAGLTADATFPALPDYASGQALATLQNGLREARSHGIVIRGQLLTSPVVTSASPPGSPSQVGIRDCLDDTRWLNYVAATGRLQDNVPGGRRLVTAVVTRSAAGWRVTRLAVGAEGTC